MSTAAPAFLDIDALTVRYRLDGQGAAVLLLHGWGGSLESWGPVFDDLRRAHTVCAFDLPGFGASTRPAEAWGSADYAQLTLRLMDRLGLRRPHLLGHSFGGQVSIRLAAAHPQRVGKLILVSSAGVRRRRPWRVQLKRALAGVGKLAAAYGGSPGRRLREAIYRRVQSSDYASAGPLRATLVKVVNEDVTALLPSIASPTLLVWGERDPEVPVAAAQLMAQLMPRAQLVVFENAGHFPYLDHFGRFRLVVGRFLRDEGGQTVEPAAL
jgi:pimeloyl-ACP methyl ester carboxylesterase